MAKTDYMTTSSLDANKPFNYRNLEDRARYNRYTLGTASGSEIGVVTASDSSNVHARPPSWTQHHAGLSHAYVISPLSASQHEVTSLNCYLSGVFAIESASLGGNQIPVPASGAVYYSKANRLVKKVYKTVATSDMATDLGFSYNAAFGILLESFSSSATMIPIPLEVSGSGRIVDVKVWVELVHDDAQFAADSVPVVSTNPIWPLGTTFVGIQSPNVNGFYSHPIDAIADYRPAGAEYRAIPVGRGVDKNVYVLWLGSNGDNDLVNLGFPNVAPQVWSKDYHMRTVFWDSSKQLNPARYEHLYEGDDFDTRVKSRTWSATGAPSYASAASGSNVSGAFYPWTTEEAIDGLRDSSHTDLSAPGSPPIGWLSAPGGIADVDEWPTSGSNLGPANMQPAFPMLDDLYARKNIDPAVGTSSATYNYYFRRWKELYGFRPGLRGTEIKGTWLLWVGAGSRTYFRQFRLEFVVEENASDVGRPFLSKHNSDVTWNNRNNGLKKIAILTGSTYDLNLPVGMQSSYDWFFTSTHVYTKLNEKSKIGRTFGITSDVSASDYAIMTRVTGALESKYLTTAIRASELFLNNEFGTPFIPQDSGSAVFGESRYESGAKTALEILTPSTITDVNVSLKSLASTAGSSQSSAILLSRVTSGSS